jgi:pyruvate dehydrogenase E1 component alpha subunit
MIPLMGAKKRNKSATAAKTRKGKSGRSNSRPAQHKAAAKKKKTDTAALAVLNADKLKELYSTMMKCRMLAERIGGTAKQEPQRVVTGLEATLVGAGAHLLPQDCIALEHGSFIASLIKGTPLHRIIARNHVSQTGNGSGKSRRGADGAATLSMAKGLPLAQEMQGKGAVMLIFCTHDAESLAFDPEAMALAATQKLPFVSLVERSFEARLQTNFPAASAPYVGVDSTFYPVIPVDGCDAVAVFRVAQEAIRRAREGHGPAVIECLTSRADVQARGAADRAAARHTAQDPISFMEQYLRKRDLWSDDWSRLTVAGFSRELDEALASVHEQEHLEADFDNVYSSDGWSSRRPTGTLLQPAAIPTL